jgi:hypothetical protein
MFFSLLEFSAPRTLWLSESVGSKGYFLRGEGCVYSSDGYLYVFRMSSTVVIEVPKSRYSSWRLCIFVEALVGE